MGNSSNKKEKKEKNEKKNIIKKNSIRENDILIIIPEKEKVSSFPSVNEIPKHNSFIDEEMNLLEKKKNALEAQFVNMRRDLKKLKNLNEIFETKTEKNINVNRRIINHDCSDRHLFLNFNIVGPIFVIFNLVGIYQLIWLLKSTKKEMTMGLNSFLFNKARNISEYEIYVEHSFNNIPDFNLFFVTSMIGNLLLKYCGYKIASFIYMIINVLIFFILNSHSFPN